MSEELKKQIREAIQEDRKNYWNGVLKTIKPFFNLGAVVTLIGLLMLFSLDTNASVIHILLVGIFIVIGIIGWDVIAGINIIEQKLKELEHRKE